MKRLLLISILFFCQVAQAGNNQVHINMDIIRQIESSGDTHAYNQVSGAAGLYQITSVCLADYNQFHPLQYNKCELFDPDINYKIANWYMNIRIPQLLEYYHLPDTIENRLIAYNAGIAQVKPYMQFKKIPQETKNYIKKYLRLLDK